MYIQIKANRDKKNNTGINFQLYLLLINLDNGFVGEEVGVEVCFVVFLTLVFI